MSLKPAGLESSSTRSSSSPGVAARRAAGSSRRAAGRSSSATSSPRSSAGCRPRRDVPPVAEHGDGVAQPEDLLHPVADVDARDAAARAGAPISAYSASASCCDRLLVGSSKTMIRAPRADRGRNLQHLLLPDAQLADARAARRCARRSPPASARPARHIAARDRRTRPIAAATPRQRFSATDRFSQNASSWWTMPMPAASACCGRREATPAAPKISTRPRVRRIDAGEDLPERALPGAVLAAERMARLPPRSRRSRRRARRTPGKRLRVTRSRADIGAAQLVSRSSRLS